MAHTCHAQGCTTPCKPEYLMCGRHWRMVPRQIQREVWAAYRPGQCDDMRPSAEWFVAAGRAIEAVAIKEGHPAPSIGETGPELTWATRVHPADETGGDTGG